MGVVPGIGIGDVGVAPAGGVAVTIGFDPGVVLATAGFAALCPAIGFAVTVVGAVGVLPFVVAAACMAAIGFDPTGVAVAVGIGLAPAACMAAIGFAVEAVGLAVGLAPAGAAPC